MLPAAQKGPKILLTAKRGENSAASGGDEGPQRDPPPTFYPFTAYRSTGHTANPS